jgi:hypothetical protein
VDHQTNDDVVGLNQNIKKDWLGNDINWLVLSFVLMGEAFELAR